MSDADPVDPRYDPRFQRGYAASPGGAPSTGALAQPVEPPAADERRDPTYVDRPLREAPIADGPAALAPHADASDRLDDEPSPEEDAAPARARGWIVLLAVVSAAAVVAGGIGVVVLTGLPPLRLALAATSASAARQLALELLSGPVLTAGLLGVAVTVALAVGARRTRDPDVPENGGEHR